MTNAFMASANKAKREQQDIQTPRADSDDLRVINIRIPADLHYKANLHRVRARPATPARGTGMMDAGFWLGVATPFAVLILFGVTRLLLRAISALMRLLNRKVHDRFMRRYVFHEEIDAGGNVNHERNARELAKVFAAAPGFRKFVIGPWQIAVCRDYRSDRKRRTQ